MKKSILSLGFAGATLASASVMFSAISASAFSVNDYQVKYNSADPDATDVVITLNGEVVSAEDAQLPSDLASFGSFCLDVVGIAVEVCSKLPQSTILTILLHPEELGDGTISGNLNRYSTQHIYIVPEPFTILGSGIALGFGGFLKRKLNPSKSSEKETTKVG